MLNPNYYMLARIMHEERIAEALQEHRHRLLRGPHVNLLTRLLLILGNRLIDLGWKFKPQTVAPQRLQEIIEA